MKIRLEDLKKAVAWAEANSRDLFVQVMSIDGNKLTIKCLDRQDSDVEITLFDSGNLMPKIRRTDILK